MTRLPRGVLWISSDVGGGGGQRIFFGFEIHYFRIFLGEKILGFLGGTVCKNDTTS